jgi:hypothetical protein
MSGTAGRLFVAVLMVGLLGGCGGDSSEPDDPPSATSASSSPEPSTPSPSAEETAYLPVPEGVQLTEQGTELAVGDSAVVAWEPRQDLVGVLDVTVTRLERTWFDDSFQGWQLDAETREATPYFVRVSIENVGVSDVGGRDVPLYAVDQADTLIEGTTFKATFEPCPGNWEFPKKFGPGDAKDLCLVYLIPDRGELTAISFRPSQDFDPITWTGPIKKVGGGKSKSRG